MAGLSQVKGQVLLLNGSPGWRPAPHPKRAGPTLCQLQSWQPLSLAYFKPKEDKNESKNAVLVLAKLTEVLKEVEEIYTNTHFKI